MTINKIIVFLVSIVSSIAITNLSLANTKPQKVASQLRAQLQFYKSQRPKFLAAEKAYKHNNIAEYKRLLRALQDYPLYPYLIAMDYSKRLKSMSSKTLAPFLKRYSSVPVVRKLRFDWLQLLAKRKQWGMFLRYYVKTKSTRYRCLHRRALWETRQRHKALKNYQSIWMTHRSLPKACDFVTRQWRAKRLMTRDLVWQRIELAFHKRASRRARNLAKYLPRRERHWVATWYGVYRKPNKVTQKKLIRSRNPIALNIMSHGLMRLARRKPDQAAALWTRQFSRLPFSQSQVAAIKRGIGLKYAYTGNPRALFWLAQVPQKYADEQVRHWRIRSSLAQEKWRQVLKWITKLTPEDRDSERWQYWKARALEALGRKQEAIAIYKVVAKSRSFEGFLASDRLKVPYTFENRALYFPEDTVLKMETRKGIVRARELYFLGRTRQARREWYYAINKFGERQLRIAAVVAHRWGWHSHVILTLGKSRFRDDLTLRFPIAHKSTVIKQARNTPVEPAWAMAVIRRESAFAPDARSHAGARGLMQLMPRTARYVARRTNTRYGSSKQLYRPKLNIRLGVSYLRMTMNKFNNNKVLATAAYNAGGNRVLQWLPEGKPKSADIWIETIPFTETRDYCRNVMAYMTIYEQRMGLKPKKLTDRLRPIHTIATQKR